VVEIDYYDIWKINEGGCNWENLPPRGNYRLRDALVKYYAWAIPTYEGLKEIAKYQPLVEIGAGTGYWAYLLRQLGVNIKCYDQMPYKEQVDNKWSKVKIGTPKTLLWVKKKRNLFLCWPPSNYPMAKECLKYFRGKYVIYIGESEGGCNASDDFFNILREDYEEIEHEAWIPHWFGLHDYLSIWRKL
jgi:hypothetical protein